MNKSAHFEIQLLNLKTGQKREFTGIPDSKFETIVFEHTDFPLVHKIFNESVNIYILEGCENETL
jgi:translation elongation factor P/translation initiation factor 5A